MSTGERSGQWVGAPAARSALFVPGNRADMLGKAHRYNPDIIICDLEDAVPPDEKGDARVVARRWLDERDPSMCSVTVRINALEENILEEDLELCAHPGVTTVMVPKITEPGEVQTVEEVLERLEGANGSPRTWIWPLIETAKAVRNAYEIVCASDRVFYTGGSAGDDGDLAREIGFLWTPSFVETLFIRSKVLVDVRAAGIGNPMTGVVTNLSDPGQVEAYAIQSRDLGYAGMMVIHPSHVAIVNEVFSVSEARLEWARSVIETIENAAATRVGAIRHNGAMIDVAMVNTARLVLERAAVFDES
jgi:citrate lyase subunit beta/citryl-CoA lyase